MNVRIIHAKYYLALLIYVALSASDIDIFAQNARVYADFDVVSNSSLLASITNEINAHDGDPQTFATLSVPLSLLSIGHAYLRPRFDHTVPAGTSVRIKVGKAPGLLELASSVSIRAYQGVNAVSTQLNLGSLISLLAGRETSEVIFTPMNASGVPVSFDRIEIRLTGLLGIGLNFDVFDVYYLSYELSVCESVKDYLYGSTSNLVGALNPVINPQRAFDDDLSTYADLRSTLSVGSKTHLTALFDDPSRMGDSIHIVLKNPAGLLDLSLLTEQFAIKTYLDNTLVENMVSLETFLSLTLLPGESDVYKLSFPANESFNRIEVSLESGLINALGNLQVFDISRTEHSANIEIQDEEDYIFCVGEQLVFQQEVTYPGDSYEWKIGNEILGEEDTFSLPSDLLPGEYNVELYTYRNGCLNPTESTSISITLIDVPDKEFIDVNPSGEAKRDGDYFIYYEGLNPISLSPIYNADLTGEFSWYMDEAMTIPIYDGMVDHDGTTYSIDENNVLTIDNWVLRDPDTYEFFLAYTNQLGCLDVKPFNFEAIFVILPIEITNFKTQILNTNQVHITWYSEIEAGFFEVQRAEEDLIFRSISTHTIAMENEFTFIDSSPKRVNYYRVVYKDLDQNHLFYSSLLRVNMPHLDENMDSLNVYPNPFINEINILSNIEKGEYVLIRIISADGNHVVVEKWSNSQNPNEVITITDLFHLQKGSYILQIIGQKKLFTTKILK